MPSSARTHAEGIAQYVTTHVRYGELTDMERMVEAVLVAVTEPTAAKHTLAALVEEHGLHEVLRMLGGTGGHLPSGIIRGSDDEPADVWVFPVDVRLYPTITPTEAP